MVEKEDVIIAGACTASAILSVLIRSPDLLALPIFAIASKQDVIREKLEKSGKFTQHEINAFFKEIDCLVSRAEKKLKEVI